jgi:Arc/MetJ-type ribon-helix-helix transcriptional regulator
MPKKGYTSVTLPSSLVREARKLLKGPTGERYRSLSELVSEAIEERLEVIRSASMVSTRTVQTEEAKRMITDYLKDNPGAHYPSDIAYSLGLDLDVVFEITQSLFRDHIIETKTISEKVIEAR